MTHTLSHENARSLVMSLSRYNDQRPRRTCIMGILNLTPDSFSMDGLCETVSAKNSHNTESQFTIYSKESIAKIMHRVEAMIAEGAHIIDVGGESTRPGATPVKEEEEISRIFPIVQSIRHIWPELPLSVDTTKASVAHAALSAGVNWINDVSGLHADAGMKTVIAAFQAPCVLMHNANGDVAWDDRLGGSYVRSHLKGSSTSEAVCLGLQDSLNIARSHGIDNDIIVIDPGIGFGKTVQQNLEIMHDLDKICHIGSPVLVGASRKSFVGHTLDQPVHLRQEGSVAAAIFAVTRGAAVVRVHDVQETALACRMVDAMMNAAIPAETEVRRAGIASAL